MIISYSKKELRCFISFCMIVERIVVVADIWRGEGACRDEAGIIFSTLLHCPLVSSAVLQSVRHSDS